MTVAAFAAKVEEEWAHLKDGPATLTIEEIQRVAQAFVVPQYETLTQPDTAFQTALAEVPAFARWVKRNTHLHKQQGYRAAILSLKATGQAPGDLDADRMEKVAEWAQQWSFGEIRVSHEQNLVLPHVAERDLFSLWQAADAVGLAHPNAGLLTDIICCPGGDFCSLANAKSIPVAEAIQHRFADLDYLFDLGDIALNISGCMNACGHHHVGNIGVLGVDKNGEEWYQITLGGHQGPDASLGKVIGPSFARAAMPDVIEKIIQVYVERREPEERFLDTFRRIGIDVFKERVYAKAS